MKEFIKKWERILLVLYLCLLASIVWTGLDSYNERPNEPDQYQAGYLAGNHACQVANERLDELKSRVPLEIK